MKTKFQVLHYCFGIVIATIIIFSQGCVGNQTSVGFSEKQDVLVLTAEFPKQKSGIVYDYLKSELGLYDLSGLGFLEIMKYQTPDRRMNFYIKSRLQYFEIKMERSKNSHEACETLKRAAVGLKVLLTS